MLPIDKWDIRVSWISGALFMSIVLSRTASVANLRFAWACVGVLFALSLARDYVQTHRRNNKQVDLYELIEKGE